MSGAKLFIFDRVESPVFSKEKLDHIDALRQAVIRTPEYAAWQQYVAEERLKARTIVASHDAGRAMADYTEYVLSEGLLVKYDLVNIEADTTEQPTNQS